MPPARKKMVEEEEVQEYDGQGDRRKAVLRGEVDHHLVANGLTLFELPAPEDSESK